MQWQSKPKLGRQLLTGEERARTQVRHLRRSTCTECATALVILQLMILTMSSNPSIRILKDDNNRRGDLFSRLMTDLFLSLGYDNVRLNIARSGREIDIEAEHRLENRRALAECKAVDGKVGGKEINTFAGKLRSERRKHSGVSVMPYFISLSGFTETSVDQEAESGDEAILLIDGPRVVAELIKGRILVPFEKATERAGHCVARVNGLVLDERAELLACEEGWIWAVYYLQGKYRTHVVLVHADGTPLAAPVAHEVIEADQSVNGTLHKLICLNPEPAAAPDASRQETTALRKYYEYVVAECGYLVLDGLPTDAEVSSQHLRLENLFVPLHVLVACDDRQDGSEFDKDDYGERRPIGELLALCPRLAILGSPGGGKSTLLKRLAVAYADPTRRTLSDDRLPDRSWLPLFIRCRELRDNARLPFPELVDTLAVRSCLGELAGAFHARVDRALRSGELLLLEDGIDEISNVGDRSAFVRMLRTFLTMYPSVSFVVTSREAGFRSVAGLLAAVCVHTRLAEFDQDDVRRLILAWHRERMGNRSEVVADAERLAISIHGTDRLRRLAVNPLLLTTLLLVKRWMGQLPTRRSVLYGKAVEVLLMTWNVESYQPIEQQEALPQLCYVAYEMMRRGAHKISRTELVQLLSDAREQLSVELGYARSSITDFIEQIEHRSSLLILSGHELDDGTLTEVYEFRHLTFQEYLTAKAVVEGWYPSPTEHETLVSLLEPHFEDAKWSEVIPLAAVLAGRKADALVKHLTDRCAAISRDGRIEVDKHVIFFALGNCISDEAQMMPKTLSEALRILISNSLVLEVVPFTLYLSDSRYKKVLADLMKSDSTYEKVLADLMKHEERDSAQAFASHLPHLLACALAGIIPSDWYDLTASGFRDTTRAATRDPGLWTAIFVYNRSALVEAIQCFCEHLERFRKVLLNNDDAGLTSLLTHAKTIRDSMPMPRQRFS
jgi:hypothetical protein